MFIVEFTIRDVEIEQPVEYIVPVSTKGQLRKQLYNRNRRQCQQPNYSTGDEIHVLD